MVNSFVVGVLGELQGVVEVDGLNTTFIHHYDGGNKIKRTWENEDIIKVYIKLLNSYLKKAYK